MALNKKLRFSAIVHLGFASIGGTKAINATFISKGDEMLNVFKSIGLAILLAASPASLQASITFDFTSSGTRNDDQSLTYFANALSVNVTGFYTSDDIAPFTGFINDNASLEDTSRGIRFNRNGNDFAGIDGRDQNELARFEFNIPVRIERIGFTFVERNDQFDFFADTNGNGIVYDNFIGHFDPSGSPSSFTFASGSPLASVFGIGAGFTENNDDFSISSITVTAIPEPATWLMIIFGFAVIGLQLRRRNRQRFASQ
ncbi:PEPxxWA-CTERM sorting domain-containing protein [Kordiimonas sp. SCSIO 12610]|uniref:PEPxxWA-CTERM sorting domain-containing protein n=1 Tax=Kordiimonas sp. SCSIO 12610 TaxID=2829597 RepID=UPI0021087673|nr:PEPxxWA-CTERM sorting domain-containing protein [Kordiimonas sp. SCSIO 12610]UTW56692.1 PEPxxWA-CTERM sorting domain-containing protein [Kordiimonas sp. SCSIO 12610]